MAQRITIHMWFDSQAEDAAKYCTIILKKLDIPGLKRAYDGK